MTLALRSPKMVANLVAVDNAPVGVALNKDFAQYIRGMHKIQDSNVTRQAEADRILRDFEQVGGTCSRCLRHPLGPRTSLAYYVPNGYG